jgi:predicted lactoylglutathione lyase
MITLKLPKPKIGDVYALTISTKDISTSVKFYQQLGFKEISRSDCPFPFSELTDGALLIMLREDKKPYIALTYYVKNPAVIVKELEEQGIKFVQKPVNGDFIQKYLLQSPDGLNISIVANPGLFRQPKGPSMLHMRQADYIRPDKYVNKYCGMFGEFAHPVADLQLSVSFWEKLGFTVLSEITSPYPWAIMSDGMVTLGLHQSNHFSYPAITFFAKDMKDKIEKLKSEGLKNYTSPGGANIIVTTPEDQHINLFSFDL